MRSLNCTLLFAMSRVFICLALALLAAVLAAEQAELKIEVTHKPVRCTQLTKKGDKVSVHYEGRLTTETGKVRFLSVSNCRPVG